jgi:hypothetical protein
MPMGWKTKNRGKLNSLDVIHGFRRVAVVNVFLVCLVFEIKKTRRLFGVGSETSPFAGPEEETVKSFA